MIQRCLAILIKALSLVFTGSVDIQYLVGSQLYTPLFLRQFEYPNRFFWTNLAE